MKLVAYTIAALFALAGAALAQETKGESAISINPNGHYGPEDDNVPMIVFWKGPNTVLDMLGKGAQLRGPLVLNYCDGSTALRLEAGAVYPLESAEDAK